MSKIEIPASSVWFLCIVYSIESLLQATQAIAVTDPVEVAAVRSLSEKWSIGSSGTWNLTDPCYGVASSTAEAGNPGIKCVCTYNNGTICHVTQIHISGLDKTGQLSEEMANLTYLSQLNLGQNNFNGRIPAFLGKLTNMQYLALGINNFSGPVPKELGNLQNLIGLVADN